jgi:hypothetical protein
LAWVRAELALVLTEGLKYAPDLVYCEINLWALDYTDLTTLIAVAGVAQRPGLNQPNEVEQGCCRDVRDVSWLKRMIVF